MLAAHDEILRKAVSKRDGIVFKEIGDAFAALSKIPKMPCWLHRLAAGAADTAMADGARFGPAV